jgi:hypothetical protein
MDMSLLLRRLLLLGTPAILGFLEIFHPRAYPPYFENLLPQADWWFVLHLLQLPLFGLLGLAVLVLTRDLQGRPALVSRIGIAFYLVFYTALDAITGIATGVVLRAASGFTPDQRLAAAEVVRRYFEDPLVGGNTLSLTVALGGLGWCVGIVGAAIALWRASAPRVASVLLGLSFIFAVHPFPTGTLGMAFFFAGALWMERVATPHTQPSPAHASR